jgi:hypothetical protein
MSTVVDEDLDCDLKAEMVDWLARRDEVVLERLKEQGFALGFLPPTGPPVNAQLDFSILVSKLNGISNLVVAAPQWTLEKVYELFERLPRREFAHGKSATVVAAFTPSPENWIRCETEILHIAGAAFEPPYDGGAGRTPWAHCATLNVFGAGTKSQLTVIHVGGIGPGRDAVYLGQHSLVPRLVLL